MKPDTVISPADRASRLLKQVADAIRIRHYSIRTEEAYVHWLKASVRLHGLRHPREIGAREVMKFLLHLATECDVAAANQQQALSALISLYRDVLEIDLPWLDDLIRLKKPAHLPTVLNQDEVARLIDFVRHENLIRDGKGAKDWVTGIAGAFGFVDNHDLHAYVEPG